MRQAGRRSWVPDARWAVMTLLATAACSSPEAVPGPTPPASPAATPTPPAAVPPASFLFLLQAGNNVDTYRIDAAGRVQFVFTQHPGRADAIAADPAGRRVYLAYGPRALSEMLSTDASIELNEVDDSGNLVLRSQSRSRPWDTAFFEGCDDIGWQWLAATEQRVWGIFRDYSGHACHTRSYIGVTSAVSPDDELGPPVIGRGPAGSGDWVNDGSAAVDPATDVLYKGQDTGPDVWAPGPLTSYVVGSDSLLSNTGVSSLCVASDIGFASPLVAVRGYVFASAKSPVLSTVVSGVCSWQGPRLAPRSSLGFDASRAAAYSPADPTTPAALAMAGDVYANGIGPYQRTDLRLLSMDADGEVALLDTAALTSSVRQLAFHPSGHYLYVVGDDGGLYSYSVAGRKLEPIETVPNVAASSYPGASPTLMAISVVQSDAAR
ncbi:MAG TPA: hypothetical protein VMK12_03830 [Anaeromyxobacteraceae bacterium]|nr:hypothetical protein [Anaeromyxobacteraceae bacterium]